MAQGGAGGTGQRMLNNQLHAVSTQRCSHTPLSSQPAQDPAAPLWKRFPSLRSYPLVNATAFVGRNASIELQ